MKKKEIIIILALLLAAVAYYAYGYIKNLNADYVILRDMTTGEIVDRISLNKDANYEYDGLYGKFRLEVKDKGIRAKDVECPNHSCEKMGTISREYQGLGGIICIPNGFEVYFDE